MFLRMVGEYWRPILSDEIVAAVYHMKNYELKKNHLNIFDQLFVYLSLRQANGNRPALADTQDQNRNPSYCNLIALYAILGIILIKVSSKCQLILLNTNYVYSDRK